MEDWLGREGGGAHWRSLPTPAPADRGVLTVWIAWVQFSILQDRLWFGRMAPFDSPFLRVHRRVYPLLLGPEGPICSASAGLLPALMEVVKGFEMGPLAWAPSPC